MSKRLTPEKKSLGCTESSTLPLQSRGSMHLTLFCHDYWSGYMTGVAIALGVGGKVSHDTEDETISCTQPSASIVIYHHHCVDRLQQPEFLQNWKNVKVMSST